MFGTIHIRTVVGVLLLLISAETSSADNQDQQCLYDFFYGSYILIGKFLNKNDSYIGMAILSSEGNRLKIERFFAEETSAGFCKIETALGQDEAQILRCHFNQKDQKLEGTYLWRSDLDNYARISGYVYSPGVQTGSPGMEVMFIDHSKRN